MNDTDILSMGKKIDNEDIPEGDMRTVAEIVGVENTIKLALRFSGLSVYFSKEVITTCKKKYAMKSFDGSNIRKLTIELGTSEKNLRRWLEESKHPKSPAMVKQLDLFKAD
jgi:Mor family transcriptional regulator